MYGLLYNWIFWLAFYGLLGLIGYWYLNRNFNYWSKRGVFQLPPEFLYGNIKPRIKRLISFHQFTKEFYFKTIGHKYAGIYEGRIPRLAVLDPGYIKLILLKDFDHFTDRNVTKYKPSKFTSKMVLFLSGSDWKNVRMAITPSFSSGKIKKMFDLVVTCSEQLQEFIHSKLKDNGGTLTQEINVKDTLGQFTLDVIANCAFGVHTNSLQNTKSELIKQLENFGNMSFLNRAILITDLIVQLPAIITRKLSISFFNEDTVHYLTGVVKETIKIRKERNLKRNDFLQLMIDAAETENNEKKDYCMDEETIISQSILFFIAGFETSSTLLSSACYELAKNEAIQDKLYNEIMDILNKYNGVLTYEGLCEMNYLEMVLSETLRMYPPTARLDRISTKDYTFPDGLTIEKNTRIMIPTMGLHYDPQYYPDPDKFDPSRFSAEKKQQRSPYVYLPFGLGPRNCIGLRFAMMSTKACMVYLIKDFIIRTCKETVIPFKFDKKSILLKSEGGLFVAFEKR